MNLGPYEINGLANCICGHDGTAAPYRTGTDIERFRAFARAVVEWDPGDSRFTDAVAYLEACNRTPVGASGLPVGIEKVVCALADRRVLPSQEVQAQVADELTEILEAHQVDLRIDTRGRASIAGFAPPGQALVDEEIHTVFEDVLHESDLDVARTHYVKARRLMQQAEPDFANAAKEAICSVESLLLALTDEKDLNKALAKAVKSELIPSPLGQLVRKLYAYRGDEPGVAHAGSTVPDVDIHDAQFVINQAATIGVYLRAKLTDKA